MPPNLRIIDSRTATFDTVFIRQDSCRYRFVGNYAAQESYTVPNECTPYLKGTGFRPMQVSRVIKMRKAS